MTEAQACLVTDEAQFMRQHLPLQGAHLVELGCGKAELARRLLQQHGVAEMTALEVDARQPAANLAAPALRGLRYALGGAESTGFPAACCDGVMMLKSLHHVPLTHLDRALDGVARILRRGGWFYVSEPVYAGAFNEVRERFQRHMTADGARFVRQMRINILRNPTHTTKET